MPNNDPGRIIPKNGGFAHDLALRVKLILRLIADHRISPWVKLLPLGSVLYLFFPDLAPGPIDDAAIIWLGFTLFVELCPPEIVQEHVEELTGSVIVSEWRDAEDAPQGPDAVDRLDEGTP